jgi:hypothetical protein
MAIGWLTVLQSVPWAEVVSNAPKVAAGAKKLWGAVGKKPAPDTSAAAEAPATFTPEAQSVAALGARIVALETATADLQSQMVASSELIQALAEQNSQLILRIESMRRRLWWLAAALLLGGVVVAVSLARVLMR